MASLARSHERLAPFLPTDTDSTLNHVPNRSTSRLFLLFLAKQYIDTFTASFREPKARYVFTLSPFINVLVFFLC
jgi:hypothetical protein